MAPREIRLFSFGENPSEKGTFYLDQSDAAEVMARYQARRTDLSFDYDHAILAPPGLPKPAAGWGALALRSDGIWAVNLRWTDEAAQLIASEKYRYFSPVFEHTDDGHILNVVNVALTNTPALHGIPPLLAAASVLAGRRVSALLVRPLSVAPARRPRMTPEEMSAALEAVKPHVSAESLEKLAAEMMASLSDKLPAGEPLPESMGADPPTPPPAEDKDAAEKASALAALCKVTGETVLARAVGKLQAMALAAPQAEALAAKVARLETELRGRDVQAKIDGAKRQGRITPAMGAVEKAALAIGHESLEGLDAFLSALPIVGHPAGPHAAAKPNVTVTGASVRASDVAGPQHGTATDIDFVIGRKLGLTDEQIRNSPATSAGIRLR